MRASTYRCQPALAKDGWSIATPPTPGRDLAARDRQYAGTRPTSEVRLVKLERKQTLLAGWFGKINHTGELVRMFAAYL